jgi:hypothetical protein
MSDLGTKIATIIGYDVSDIQSQTLIELLVDAGIEDMKAAGVPETLLVKENTPKLVVSTLVIFVNDNLNLTSGDHKTSMMYIANVDKLRSTIEAAV